MVKVAKPANASTIVDAIKRTFFITVVFVLIFIFRLYLITGNLNPDAQFGYCQNLCQK
jgi:hypothetical protein